MSLFLRMYIQIKSKLSEPFSKAWIRGTPDIEAASKTPRNESTEAEDRSTIHQHACDQPASIDLIENVPIGPFSSIPTLSMMDIALGLVSSPHTVLTSLLHRFENTSASERENSSWKYWKPTRYTAALADSKISTSPRDELGDKTESPRSPDRKIGEKKGGSVFDLPASPAGISNFPDSNLSQTRPHQLLDYKVWNHGHYSDFPRRACETNSFLPFPQKSMTISNITIPLRVQTAVRIQYLPCYRVAGSEGVR